MGMDMNLYRARCADDIDYYYASWDISKNNEYEYKYDDDEDDVMPVAEIYYSRKFWDLYEAMSFTKDYECGEYIRLSKEQVKEMLDYSVLHPDYFGDFNTVVNLCRIYYKFDEWEKRGLHVFFECDW